MVGDLGVASLVRVIPKHDTFLIINTLDEDLLSKLYNIYKFDFLLFNYDFTEYRKLMKGR